MRKLLPKKKQADQMCAKIVKARDKICRKCGSPTALQWAHLISRSYLTVRWDLRNSVALCNRCHMYYTFHPEEWRVWCKDYLGDGGWEALKLEARTYKKLDYKTILSELADYRG